MNRKPEYIVDLLFNKLKNYKAKKIFLEKKHFREFIFSLLREN